jgi:hypothetical protein
LEGDVDQDGHQVPEDCDDNAADIYPGAPEVCDDIDQDCDGDLVASFPDLDGDGTPDCIDDDVDGDGVLGSEDCNDQDPSVGEYGALGCPYPWFAGIGSCRDAAQRYGEPLAGDDDDSAPGEDPAIGTTALSGFYEVLAPGENVPITVYCDMGHSGGGWTLVLIAAADGVDTWTWGSSQLLTNITAPIGDLASQAPDFASAVDFKSPTYHTLLFTDLLFIHHSAYTNPAGEDFPFETWAAYDEVGDASETLPAFMLGQVAPSCLEEWVLNGSAFVSPEAQATAYPMSAGTVTQSGALCDTNLYFHLGGHNTYQGRECDNPANPLAPHSYGPAWAAVLGPDTHYTNCGSGPGWSSLGPGANHAFASVADPLDESLIELPGLGFGEALGLNLADSGTGINHLRMYIR